MNAGTGKRVSVNDFREQIVRIEQMQADTDLTRQNLTFGRSQLVVALLLTSANLLASGAAFMKLVMEPKGHAIGHNSLPPQAKFLINVWNA